MYKIQSEKQETETIPKSAKYEIQELFEKILVKHEIELEAFAYNLMLSNSPMDDLLIRKKGDRIRIGFNFYFLITDGEKINDVVISFDYNKGLWIPTEIENSIFENTENDEEWLSELTDIFKGQEWLDKGVLKNRGQLDTSPDIAKAAGSSQIMWN
jgi:hypothetical protein